MHLTVSSLNTNRLTLQFHSKCAAECNFIYEMCCWVIWFQLQCFRQFIKYHRILKWFGSILDNFSLDRTGLSVISTPTLCHCWVLFFRTDFPVNHFKLSLINFGQRSSETPSNQLCMFPYWLQHDWKTKTLNMIKSQRTHFPKRFLIVPRLSNNCMQLHNKWE